MKILLFAASFPLPAVGGSVEYLHNITKNLPSNSVTIHTGNAYPDDAVIFDKLFPQNVIRSNFIHHPMEGHKRSKVRRAWQYIAWPIVAFWLIIKLRPDTIHIGEGNTASLAAWLARKLLGIPYVHYVYAEEITLYRSNWMRENLFWLAVKGAQAVVTVSEYSRNLLVSGGVLPARIHKIVPAVGDGKCTEVSVEQVEFYRKKYRLENNRVLLTVGALKERKGQVSVVEALKLIIQIYPNVKYVMVGSGEQEATLRQKVKDLCLAEHVVFAGRLDNQTLNCLYEICDIFIMPHRQVAETLDTEGCPTVFLEASAHGKPVIGGNAGGVSDAILDKITGLIIDGSDVNAISANICNLLMDSSLANRLGQAGRDYVLHHSPVGNANKIWQINQDIFNK